MTTYCHNLTQLQIGVDKVISWTTTPPNHLNFQTTYEADFWCATQLNEIWKKTSIFLKMEDMLIFSPTEDNLNFTLLFHSILENDCAHLAVGLALTLVPLMAWILGRL